GQMNQTEVDKLHRVIVQYEDIARFHIAMNEPDIMRGLQASSRLRNDIHHPVRGEPHCVTPDSLVQSEAREKGHDKERLLSIFFVNAGIVKIDDVRVFQFFKDVTLSQKPIELLRIQKLFNRFQRNVALQFAIDGAVYDPHAAFADDLFELIPTVELRHR